MAEFLQSWGYLGVFLGIILTVVPFLPLSEELPVVLGGALAGSGTAIWWIMLPLCIVAVVIGDGLLYSIGRFWGPRLLEYGWVKKRLLPPERLAGIQENVRKHGIKILLFARLTPGFRSPVFFAAGLTRMSPARFFLADGIYAIPGVTLLFFLGYWFSGSMVDLINNEVAQVKNIMIVIAVLAVAGYFLYRYLRRPVVTGDPSDIPPLPGQITHALKDVTLNVGRLTTQIIHPKGKESPSGPVNDARPRQEGSDTPEELSSSGSGGKCGDNPPERTKLGSSSSQIPHSE